MPLHDWTRVSAGIFHSFEMSWVTALRKFLNCGGLPTNFYALIQDSSIDSNSEIIEPVLDTSSTPQEDGGTALLVAEPQTRISSYSRVENYTDLQKSIAIRHASDQRIVALIEIVSSGNKGSVSKWRTFVDKALAALNRGIHLLILDPYPPTPRDPGGVHGAIWGELTGESFALPADHDRTLAAYRASLEKAAFVEPIAVGQALRAMPLYLTRTGYIEVPLEATYNSAFEGVPRIYRNQLAA